MSGRFAPHACTPKGGAATPERHANYGNQFRATTSKDFSEILSLIDMAIHSATVLEVMDPHGMTEQELREVTREGRRPVVFRGYARDWQCVKQWSKPGILESLAEEELRDFPHRKYRTFFPEDEGRLHLTDGKSKAKFLSLQGFLDTAKVESSPGLQNSENIRPTLSRHDSATCRARSSSRPRTPGNFSAYLLGIHDWRGGNSTFCPVQRHPEDPEARLPPLARYVPPFPLVDHYAKSFGAPYDHQQFFLTRGYAYTDLHYDSYDNFYVAVSGKRKWTLAPPALSRWLVESSGGALKSGSQAIPHKMIFGEHPTASLFPFANVELFPGDVLYVPATWWHLVESVPGPDGFSCAFNYFFSRDADLVIGEVEELFKKWDGRVSQRQAECRAVLAGFSRYDERTAGLLKKPKGLSDEKFSVIRKVLTVCGKEDWIDKFVALWDAPGVLVADDLQRTVEVKTPKSARRTPRKKHEELFFSPQETPVKGIRAMRRA